MQASIGASTNTSMNSPVSTRLAHHLPLGAKRRDERAQDDQPGIDHQLGDLADAPDVLDAVGLGEAEIAVEAVAHVVAVEHVVCTPRACSRSSTRLAIVDLPAPDRPVNHRIAGRWCFRAARACLGRPSASCRWMLVARRRREGDQPGADRRVGEAVDQDEGAGVAGCRHRDRRRSARPSRGCRRRSR